MKKKQLTAVFAALGIMASALAGCSGSSSGSTTAAAPAAAESSSSAAEASSESTAADSGTTQEIQKGGTLTISLPNYTPLLDPKEYTQAFEASIITQVAEPLLMYNAEYTDLIPVLATDWDISYDGLSYHFTIRDDVYFQPGTYQNGRKLVADDVKFSLERIAAESSQDHICREFFDYVEVLSDTEFTIHLKESCGPFLEQLADAANVIIPHEEVEGWGDNFVDHLIGSGPFVLESMKVDDSITLKRNENYWGEKANLDEVVFKVISDGVQSVNALITNEVQIADYLQAEAIEAAKNAGMLVQKPTTGCAFVRFNMQSGPTADPKVREAILKAIDFDAVLSNVYQYGEAIRAYQPLTYLSWAYDEKYSDLFPSYDPEGAKELLKEAGYENGMTLNIYVANTTTRERIAQMFQYYLAEVGITLNIRASAFSETLASVTESWKSDTVNMYSFSWTSTLDPYGYLERLYTQKNLGATANAGGYMNDEVEELLHEAFQATDHDVRKELYGKVMETVMKDNTGAFFAYEARNWGISPKVHDSVQRADGRALICTPFNNIWVEH